MSWLFNKNLALLAWRNLRRNKRRNLATGLAIAAGFTAFLLAASYAYRVQRVLSSYTVYALHVGHIGVYKKEALELFSIKPKEYSLTAADQGLVDQALQGLENVEMKGSYLTGQGLIGNGCKTFPFLATGVDVSIEDRVMNHPVLKRWTQHLYKHRVGQNLWDFPDSFGAILISSGLAQLLGKSNVYSDLKDAKAVMITDCTAPETRDLFSADANVQFAAGSWDGTLNAIDGEIIGRYTTGLQETNNTAVLMPLPHLQKLLNTDHVSHISVWLKEPLLLDLTLSKLRDRLRKTAPHLDALPWRDERLSPYYTGTMQFIFVMVAFIGCVLAVVIILSIFNSATMTVIERSQEIGMFRSIGYNSHTMRKIFLIEGFLLTGLALIGGIILGLTAMLLINNLDITLEPPGVAGGIQLIMVPNILIITAGSLAVSSLGIGSTWIAVNNVVKQNIAHLVNGAHR
jgi:putative ABC transport system permease protein